MPKHQKSTANVCPFPLMTSGEIYSADKICRAGEHRSLVGSGYTTFCSDE